MGMVDPEFRGVGQKEGLRIWRIEQMKVAKIPEKDYGHFFMGDSYILLHTKSSGGGFVWNIHFWLGKETSQDEAGVAAYKTTELDDHLGGSPTQHREVQEAESKLFLSYFKQIVYEKGGVASGFRHVERNKHDPKLSKVKGKRNVRVIPVDLTWDSFNNGDVFILELNQKIYVWCGSKANRQEKLKGGEYAKRVRDDMYGGKAHIVYLEEGETLPEDITKALGPPPKSFKDSPEEDETFARKNVANTKLYHVTDESGALVVTEKAVCPLTQDLLDSNDCYIIDQGSAGIYVWKGKSATQQEKVRAMKNAEGFIKAKQYPKGTQITAVGDGGEPTAFKYIFKNWREKNASQIGVVRSPRGNIARVEYKKFDATSLHKKSTGDFEADPSLAATHGMPDDGTGTIKIWRIEDFEKVELDPSLYGQFFGGDSYVILYTYKVRGREQYIIYFWQGQESSQDEKGASAIHAQELDDSMGGAPVQVRVVQNKEPRHFQMIFKGKMIIHMGGKASGFKNRQEQDKAESTARLFQVRGTNELNTKAIEVPARASALNSNDVFVLKMPNETFLWCGKGGSGDERELAKGVAKTLAGRASDYTMVPEGQEPASFWSALGGKASYANTKSLETEVPDFPPRLFQCSNASGNFMVEEIHEFTQEDMVQDDVMLLDAYHTVFVWIGSGANEVEKKEAINTAKEYILSDPSGRDVDATSLIKIQEGNEPLHFTGHFHAWNPNYFKELPNLDDMKAQAKKDNEKIAITSAPTLVRLDQAPKKQDGEDFNSLPKYSLEKLQSKELPEDVDVSKKEYHLSAADFEKVFKMKFPDYVKLPGWKRNKLRKDNGLF
ncbi:advillin-like isoform X1 [Acanthaster planci]|uniref:Advillin-like isoform X1 n=2 Tax=Acanthaster planci TaxID=133434 RepID=A0A8B7ZUW0_ACAPL|nr:advillin-like isoform X1 [Acanthaster planci]XP_022109348.1 advillin-like isoform X1 [Acanthaster planci]